MIFWASLCLKQTVFFQFNFIGHSQIMSFCLCHLFTLNFGTMTVRIMTLGWMTFNIIGFIVTIIIITFTIRCHYAECHILNDKLIVTMLKTKCLFSNLIFWSLTIWSLSPLYPQFWHPYSQDYDTWLNDIQHNRLDCDNHHNNIHHQVSLCWMSHFKWYTKHHFA